MAVVINAKGTSVQQFQIGKQGPLIKNVSGNINFKDSTDSSLAGITIDSEVVGSPTGGDKGSGSINTETLYINGTQLANNSATFNSDIFTGDGSTTGFTLSRTPISEDAILVAVSGLLQDGDVDYTVSGTTLTFTTAPPSSAKILVLFRDSFGTATLVRDDFTGDGSTTGFTLTEDPGVAANLLVFIDGVTQYTPDAYTVSGTTLTFTSAPANTADIQTVQLNTGLASIVPSDSSVTFAKLDSSLQANFGNNKNVIINGNFDIWQRGTSGFTTSGYTADRWRVTPGTGVTFSIARQTNTLGDGQSEFALRWDQTVAGSTASLIEQRIEGVQTFNGQTVTISVDTDLVSGSAPTVQLRIEQNFGTGGSPSASVFSAVTAISIPGTRANQSVTFSLASISGKTLGSNGDDYLAVQFVIGNAVFAMDLNECQIEAGSVATTFERRSFAQELAMCQRYYEKSYDLDVFAGALDSNGAHAFRAQGTAHTEGLSYKVAKRIAPTITLHSAATGDSGQWRDSSAGADRAVATALVGENAARVLVTSSVDDNAMNGHFTADAEL